MIPHRKRFPTLCLSFYIVHVCIVCACVGRKRTEGAEQREQNRGSRTEGAEQREQNRGSRTEGAFGATSNILHECVVSV